MEIGESWGRESVMVQLNEGIKLTNKLKEQLQNSNSSDHDCGFLIEKIVSCYDNALALLNYMKMKPLPTSFEDFHPKTELFHHHLKDHVSADVPKKRKILARWREEVHVCSKIKYEGEDEDEYNWRKYGQKDILGATHPRSYYRCTHRRTRGCLARKQVQRGEDDPRILNILYRGKHTCGVKEKKENDDIVNHEDYQQVKLQQENVAPLSPLILSSNPTSESSCISNQNNFNIDQIFLDSFAFGDIYHLLNDHFDDM